MSTTALFLIFFASNAALFEVGAFLRAVLIQKLDTTAKCFLEIKRSISYLCGLFAATDRGIFLTVTSVPSGTFQLQRRLHSTLFGSIAHQGFFCPKCGAYSGPGGAY